MSYRAASSESKKRAPRCQRHPFLRSAAQHQRVIGSGASGLPCAIRAREAGLRVLVIDQNFDVGGKMLHSGAQIALGGGDPVQLRDIADKATRKGSSRSLRCTNRRT